MEGREGGRRGPSRTRPWRRGCRWCCPSPAHPHPTCPHTFITAARHLREGRRAWTPSPATRAATPVACHLRVATPLVRATRAATQTQSARGCAWDKEVSRRGAPGLRRATREWRRGGEDRRGRLAMRSSAPHHVPGDAEAATRREVTAPHRSQ